MIKTNRQAKINKMLKGIKSKREVFETFGYVLRTTYAKAMIIIDNFIPSFRLITVFASLLIFFKIDKELVIPISENIINIIRKVGVRIWKNQ